MAKKQQAPIAWGDRVFALVEGGDSATAASKLQAFQWIFVLILCVEYWARVARPGDLGLSDWLAPVLVLAFGSATLLPHWRRIAFVGLATVQAVRLWQDFPTAGNHSYLEVLLCAVCAFLDTRRRDEGLLLLQTVRWMTCVVFFFAGIQKVVHGYYFRGELLAYSIGIEAFKPVLKLVLSPDDFVRLSHYHLEAGSGPYLASSLLLIVLSNATYVIEIGLVPLLIWRPTRRWAVVGAIVFLLGVETAAREFFFGLMYINMLLVFFDSDFNRRMVGAFGAVLLSLLLVRFNVLPEVIFY